MLEELVLVTLTTLLVHNVEHGHYGCEWRVLWALSGWVKYRLGPCSYRSLDIHQIMRHDACLRDWQLG